MKKEVLINSFSLVLGIGVFCAVFLYDNLICSVLEALAIALITANIINLFDVLLLKKEGLDNNLQIYRMGQAKDKKINYRNSKKLNLLFHTANSTLKLYDSDFVEAVINNNCNICLIVTSPDVMDSDSMNKALCRNIDAKKEVEAVTKFIREMEEIIRLRQYKGQGSIKLYYSSHYPTGSIELCDDKYCYITPYIPHSNSSKSYFLTFKRESSVYKHYEEAFINVLKEASIIVDCDFKN